MKNNYYSTNTKCHFDVFHYTYQRSNDENLDATYYDLYNDIISMNYTKNISNPAGSWNIKLLPNLDYSKIISPGDWVQCFIEQNGIKNCRFIGNVDRVALEQSIHSDGIRESYYVVSGRDWGKIFEDSSVFFNPFTLAEVEPIFVNKMNGMVGSPNILIKNMINMFLNDTMQIPDCSQSLNYWYISDPMARIFNTSGHPQFADLIDLSDLDLRYPGYKTIPMVYAQGNVWSVIKGLSNEIIYTLYCELVDEKDSNNNVISKPKLFFHAWPYCFKSFSTNKIPIKYFLDLPSVNINGDSILNVSVGTNDHDRVNLIFLQLKEEPIFLASDAQIYATLDEKTYSPNSIKRHGLRMMNKTLDYNLTDTSNNLSTEIYDEAVALMRHWYFNNHLLENGSMTIVGNPNIKIGKRLVINDDPTLPKRQYFIEAYTDNWTYGDIWRQSLELTRGIFVVDNKEGYVYENAASFHPVTQYFNK